MIRLATAAALLMVGSPQMVPLHGPSGQTIWINPREITSVREPLPGNRVHYPRGARCIVVMVNGNIAVHDTCAEIVKLLLAPR